MDNLSVLERAALDELNFPAVLTKVGSYCLTEMGVAAVQDFAPIADTEILRLVLDQVQEAANLLVEGETVPFERFPDVQVLLQRSRITGNYLTAPDLLNVLEAMVVSRIMRRFLVSREGAADSLQRLALQLVDNQVMEKHITEAIDDTGMVRDTASRELHSIRREIHTLEARLRSRLQRILKKFGEEELLQDDFITQRDGRFVLPLQVQNKRAVDGIIHGVSQSGNTVFMEPAETYELNNELSLLRSREQREIINILTTLTAEVGAVSADLEQAADVLVVIDTLLARAQYAIEYGGIKPTITNDAEIELTKVHHPILRHQQTRQHKTSDKERRDNSETTVVPLSVRIDAKARGILISGPNAGGKTVAMKTIGLSLTMAYSGIFPLGTCHCPLRKIFTGIGDHQSIDANLSTFSSQIVRLRDVLQECGNDTLVLIDEICAGTDPAEGGALAAGILDSLLERGSCFVVTTHQSSLKQYALTRELITNASLAFDEQKMMPTFRFLYGVPGNSYAFDLSRNVGLPDVVLTRAKGYLGNRHDELEESISAMQRFREEAEQLRLQAASEKIAAERLRIDYEDRLSQLKAKRSASIEQAKEEARDILASANALIENTIREIREQQKSAAEIKKDFETGKQKIVVQESQSTASQESTFEIGDEAHIEGTATNGTIVAIDQKGHAVLDVNGMKMRIAVSELSQVGKSAKAPSPKRNSLSTSIAPPVQQGNQEQQLDVRNTLSLDLRGMRAEEALRQLEMFIDNAVMRNAPFVSIIHGKGTGVLREVVHQFLERQPNLTNFRLGSIPEGGDGITIVEL